MGKKKDKKPDYKARLFSFKYLLYDLVKWWGWWQCLLWYRLNIKYDGKEAKRESKAKPLFHQTMLDIVILSSYNALFYIVDSILSL